LNKIFYLKKFAKYLDPDPDLDLEPEPEQKLSKDRTRLVPQH